MDKKDILWLGKDLRFISGIYNYCDRWCERCPFTSRCLTYDMTEKIEGDLSGKENDNKIFWNEIQVLFEQACEMIIEMAENQGIDLDVRDFRSLYDEREDQFKTAKNNFLSQWAHEYTKKVNELFNEESTLSSQKSEAIEVIRWYQYFISAKIVRALAGEGVIDQDICDAVQKDADGSAKIALIGIDRSIGAWGMIQGSFPDRNEKIMGILLFLDRLRRKTEQQFPSARAFKRPGFDALN